MAGTPDKLKESLNFVEIQSQNLYNQSPQTQIFQENSSIIDTLKSFVLQSDSSMNSPEKNQNQFLATKMD